MEPPADTVAMEVRWRLPVVARLCAAVIAVLAAMHPLAALADRQENWRIETLRLMILRFDLNREQGVGTWAMAAGLALCGLVMLSMVPRAIAWRGHWRVLGILFILLSVDEVASFHELLSAPVRSMVDLPGFLYFAWVLPAGAAVLILGHFYLRFLLALPTRTRSQLLIAAAIYLCGVLVLESVGASVFNIDRDALRYEFIVLAEEMCEMVGIAIALVALLGFAATNTGPAARSASGAGSPQPSEVPASRA